MYRTSVKQNSVHHKLWQESLKILSTMQFVGKNGKAVKVPTLKNWSTTVRGKLIKKHVKFKMIRVI